MVSSASLGPCHRLALGQVFKQPLGLVAVGAPGHVHVPFVRPPVVLLESHTPEQQPKLATLPLVVFGLLDVPAPPHITVPRQHGKLPVRVSGAVGAGPGPHILEAVAVEVSGHSSPPRTQLNWVTHMKTPPLDPHALSAVLWQTP